MPVHFSPRRRNVRFVPLILQCHLNITLHSHSHIFVDSCKTFNTWSVYFPGTCSSPALHHDMPTVNRPMYTSRSACYSFPSVLLVVSTLKRIKPESRDSTKTALIGWSNILIQHFHMAETLHILWHTIARRDFTLNGRNTLQSKSRKGGTKSVFQVCAHKAYELQSSNSKMCAAMHSYFVRFELPFKSAFSDLTEAKWESVAYKCRQILMTYKRPF